ncbi:MAG TPA: hypothetical protein VGM95_02785 [Lactobacillaceae bacterium]|jgi:hypothetical protein
MAKKLKIFIIISAVLAFLPFIQVTSARTFELESVTLYNFLLMNWLPAVFAFILIGVWLKARPVANRLMALSGAMFTSAVLLLIVGVLASGDMSILKIVQIGYWLLLIFSGAVWFLEYVKLKNK